MVVFCRNKAFVKLMQTSPGQAEKRAEGSKQAEDSVSSRAGRTCWATCRVRAASQRE